MHDATPRFDYSTDAIKGQLFAELETRFWEKVEFTGFCWLWTAGLRDGYGRIRVGESLVQAHRLAYEWLVGPIPEGLQLDHLCLVRACVNPDHLDPVIQPVNIARSPRARWRRTQCPKGHPYSGDNLYILPGSGGRVCRTCQKARNVGPRPPKTHCPKGHPYSGDNLYINPSSGAPVCRQCGRDRNRRRRN